MIYYKAFIGFKLLSASEVSNIDCDAETCY